MARWLLDLRSVCGHPWRLGLASEPHELDAVFKLRYDVFVAEQGYNYVGTDRGPGRDADQFDAWCDQLFLFDEERQRVVGTYRAISGPSAVANGGFYASDEFDLAPLKPIAHEILQGGRACVAAEYRSTLAFQYLSYGMELLLREYGCKYLLGADSFRADADELNRIYSYLLRHRMDPEWAVEPWPVNRVESLREVPVSPADERTLPEIVRMDLRLGFLACSPPVWDPGFGCYDVLMLGRRDRLTRAYTGVVQRLERLIASGRSNAAGGTEP
ncbi:GNAT family N-acetyltransferase [Gemmata sp. JC673]|uniref:GNAT family N-acetyltransferase n=1 Tax=Gemmata algarum TaxID=2975278 RepID=A0ABU5F8C0_9BACT|nr:GNAT family N-acyltransferase [Gemmata algarum]MDY3562109.1 GNAT family N-acetyltransferase [Gemmata algarum]